MTWRKREIMEMAREAGELNCDCCLPYYEETDIEGFEGFLKRFAKLVREDEREACAKVCEAAEEFPQYFQTISLSAAIRARSKHDTR